MGKRFLHEHREQAILAILSTLILYFLLPYLLPMLGINSFVIISSSMTHPDQEAFERFWTEHSVPNPVLDNGFGPKDLVVLRHPDSYSVGDVVLYSEPGSAQRTAHRIFALNETHFRELGDRYITKEFEGKVALVLQETGNVSNWYPRSWIDGKIAFVVPRAGIVHFMIRCATGSKHFCRGEYTVE